MNLHEYIETLIDSAPARTGIKASTRESYTRSEEAA